jgi:hypothetical protein
MLRTMSRFIFLALLVLLAGTGAVRAASTPENLGKFGAWTAYRMIENEQAVCYMSITARPPRDKKSKTKRGDVVLMITQRPGDNSSDVVSYTAGLKFKSSSDVNVTIGSKKFNLFTQGDTAWSRDNATDRALTAAIRSGGSMTVSGVSARATTVTDTLNLKGASQAYAAMNKACGLSVPEEPKTKTKPAPKKADKKTKTKPKRP